MLTLLFYAGSSQQHPHLRRRGRVQDQDWPHQQGSCDQLAEKQTGHGQWAQVHRPHVHPQVSVPPAVQIHQPGDHGRPWDWNCSFHGLHPGERVAQTARYLRTNVV